MNLRTIIFATLTLPVLHACGSKNHGDAVHIDPAENPLDPLFDFKNAKTKELNTFYANADFDPDKTTVLVIDSGFDPRHPVFANKVIASYTMSCDMVGEKADNFSFDRPYDEIKQEAIEFYTKAPQDECQIEPGFKPKAINAFDNLSVDVKERFNNAVLAKELRTDLHDELGVHSWCESTATLGEDVMQLCKNLADKNSPIMLHGTSTAGIIAYNNPNVQLVLVESEVVNYDFVLSKDANIPCLSDNKVNNLIKLYQDQDFIDAFVNSTSPFKETIANSLYIKHFVQFENRSFILLPYNQIRLTLKMKSCLNENFKELWTLATQLERLRVIHSRETFAANPNHTLPILFQGAGHFRTEANSIIEYANCMFGQTRVFTVGYDYIDDISNYGKCVDIHYYGSSLIVPYGGDLFIDISGSSVSTPFLLRQFTLQKYKLNEVETELSKYQQTFYPLTEDAKTLIFSEH